GRALCAAAGWGFWGAFAVGAPPRVVSRRGMGFPRVWAPFPALRTPRPPRVVIVERVLKVTLPAPPVLLPAESVRVCVVSVAERSTVAVVVPSAAPTRTLLVAWSVMLLLPCA